MFVLWKGGGEGGIDAANEKELILCSEYSGNTHSFVKYISIQNVFLGVEIFAKCIVGYIRFNIPVYKTFLKMINGSPSNLQEHRIFSFFYVLLMQHTVWIHWVM